MEKYPSRITVTRPPVPATLRIGTIGRGPWGDRIVAALESLGVEIAWQAGKDWPNVQLPVDGVAIAVTPQEQGNLVEWWLGAGSPVFVEKPVVFEPQRARRLAVRNVEKVPVLVDYIGLWHPAWEEFRAKAQRSSRLIFECGKPDPLVRDCGLLWDFGPHPAAEMVDLGWGLPTQIAATEENDATRCYVSWTNGRRASMILGTTPLKRHRIGALMPGTNPAPCIFDALAPATPPPLTRALDAWLQAIRTWRAGQWDPATADRRFGFALTIKVTDFLDKVARDLRRRRQGRDDLH